MVAVQNRPTGIPTTYKGVRMRSRLEARWAAFFDAVAWPWEYEPLDLAGYIPDFVLRFNSGHIVVEVKPETEIARLYDHSKKIIRSGWPRDFIVVGACLFQADRVGVMGEPIDAIGTEFSEGPAKAFRCLSCGAVSVLSEDYGWHCRVCGEDDGNAHVGELDDGELVAAWAAAGNRVQWKPTP